MLENKCNILRTLENENNIRLTLINKKCAGKKHHQRYFNVLVIGKNKEVKPGSRVEHQYNMIRNKRVPIDATATKGEKKSSRGKRGNLCKKVRN